MKTIHQLTVQEYEEIQEKLEKAERIIDGRDKGMRPVIQVSLVRDFRESYDVGYGYFNTYSRHDGFSVDLPEFDTLIDSKCLKKVIDHCSETLLTKDLELQHLEVKNKLLSNACDSLTEKSKNDVEDMRKANLGLCSTLSAAAALISSIITYGVMS